MKRRRIHVCEAELDITAFMNLMIVLVPILLLGMVFGGAAFAIGTFSIMEAAWR